MKIFLKRITCLLLTLGFSYQAWSCEDPELNKPIQGVYLIQSILPGINTASLFNVEDFNSMFQLSSFYTIMTYINI